jgi:hypothetical protein
MFTSLLPENPALFNVVFSEYSKRFYCKNFYKKYKEKIWKLTEQAITDDLSRIHRQLQRTQQVDQLFHKETFWIFKHDFSVVKSGISPKKSGNRCICFLDSKNMLIEILLVFHHKDLPKNMSETQYIKSTLEAQFPDRLAKCR